jgi:uncharacterized protein involved in exopolysaccharide biosynthesis
MTTESIGDDDTRMDVRALVGAVLGRWFRIVVITLVLLGATYAILYFVPKMYESSAGILVETRDNAFSGPATGTATSGGGAAITIDSAISSEIELIKSRDTLISVIDEINLRSVPEFNGTSASPIGMLLQLIGRRPEVRSIDETVLTNLNDRLTVIRERDSAIISIAVRSTDNELAARIANAIAEAHVKRRADLAIQDTAEASQWLEAEIVKLRERVSDAEKAVADFRIEHDLLAGANNTSLVDQQLSTMATQITAATERRTTAQSRAALIRGLIDQGQPIDGLADVQNSVVIQQLSQSKADLQRQIAERSSTLLPNHPTMRALNAQLGEIEQQIAREGRRVATALEAEAKVEADLVASLQGEMARLKGSASDATLNTVTLDSLEREAKAQRDILESYLLRYRDAVSRSESSSALPDVRVVTAAAPSSSPASPKTSLILGAVAFVALALQVGGIIFGELLSGRALAPVRPVDGEAEAQAPPASQQDAFETMPPFDAREVEAVTPPEAEPAAAVAAAAATAPDAGAAAVVVTTEPPSVAGPPAGERDIEELLVEPEVIEAPPPPAAASVAEAALPAEPAAAPPEPNPAIFEVDLVALSSDIALGRVRLVLIASVGSARDAVPVAEVLMEEAILSGMSVAHVDAASGRPTLSPGLTDLAAGKASFGDVVHKDLRSNQGEVPWGTMTTLDRRSEKPLTLVGALADIYDVVVVSTGRIGMTSPLPLFAGADGRLLLVAGPQMDPEIISAAISDAEMLGFSAPEIVAAPMRHAVEVA